MQNLLHVDTHFFGVYDEMNKMIFHEPSLLSKMGVLIKICRFFFFL